MFLTLGETLPWWRRIEARRQRKKKAKRRSKMFGHCLFHCAYLHLNPPSPAPPESDCLSVETSLSYNHERGAAFVDTGASKRYHRCCGCGR